MTYTPGHISTLPNHDGDGYGYGADVIVSFGERAINLGPAYREGTMALARLIAAAPDLVEALRVARECIAYCRKAHPDPQAGEGMPVKVFIDAALAKALDKEA